MLTGCGSLPFSEPTPGTPSYATPQRLERGSSDPERLSAPKQKVHTTCKGFSKTSFCTYTVTGKASGPYPGTFSASGEYTVSGRPPASPNCSGRCSWNFEERFTIRSKKSRISGTISAGGNGNFPIPGPFHYTTKNGYSGTVKVQSIGLHDSDFRETFFGM
jgi:hypothetical protein